MERKNMVLLTVIAVATLLVAVVGATFAYFSTTVTDNRGEGTDKNGTTQLTTSKLADTITVANIDSAAGSFTATDVFPGHMEVAGLSVTITGESGKFAIPFEYDVTDNKIGSNVKYYLYKDETATVADLTSDKLGCTLKTETADANEVHYSEDCAFQNADSKGSSPSGITSATSLTLVATGNLSGTVGSSNAQKVQIVDDVEVTETKTVNYYFVVEYENKGEQNTEMAQTLQGKITVLGATKSA